MERRQFEHFVYQLQSLTKRQRTRLVTLLAERLKGERTAEVIEQAVRATLACPRCGTSKLYRHGFARD